MIQYYNKCGEIMVIVINLHFAWLLFNFSNSAKQNELQEDYYAVEAKRAELQRIMDAEGK